MNTPVDRSPETGSGKLGMMSDSSWERHANPWSVWTRLAAVPALAVAVWSRDWIEWWSLVPIGAVTVWLYLNTQVFRPVTEPRLWASKAIYGERMWARKERTIGRDYLIILRTLIVLGFIGMALMAVGLVRLELWPTASGVGLLLLAQCWRLDRMSWLYDKLTATGDVGAPT